MAPRPSPVAEPDLAAWSRVAREVLGTPYPWAPGHLVTGPDDTTAVPSVLHPAFHGALDWHSSVHMQWSLVTLVDRYAVQLGSAEARAARALLGERLTVPNLRVEVDYLRARPGFERPYGWAWAAQLVAAVERAGQRDELGAVAGGWREALRPLEELIAELVLAWLPRQAYPVRHGKHQNDAFALLLLGDAYARLGRDDVVAATRRQAVEWFGDDGPAPTEQEPGGSDFLSPALTEALLMTRVLLPDQARAWLGRVLPGLGRGGHARLLQVPVVRDAADGQGAHLLGLALARAWALRGLAGWVDELAASSLRAAADEQEAAVLPHLTGRSFMATHWLVSFALLAQGELEAG